MEGKKEVGGSNSSSSSLPSFTSELFGSKDSSSGSSSSGIFNSIFASSNKPLGRESVRYETMEKKQEFGNKPAAPDAISQDKEAEIKSLAKENNSYYQEQKAQPCPLSSSIYYGGQDVYNSPKSTTQSSGFKVFKDEGDDDGCASRGNWWQGSLYY